MTDRVAWLRQQLDMDEVEGTTDAFPPPGYYDADQVRRGCRLLATVEAHRAILDAYELARSHPTSLVSSFVRGQDDGFRQGLEEAVKALLSIYSDRDGYKEEWSV